MLDENLVNGVTDPAVAQLINSYVNERDKVPKCNCGNTARPCTGLKVCLKTAAPTTEGGNYTKLDRASIMANIRDEPVTETELDEIIANLENHSSSMNSKIEELRAYILSNTSNPDLGAKTEDLEILESFNEELSSMLSEQ